MHELYKEVPSEVKRGNGPIRRGGFQFSECLCVCTTDLMERNAIVGWMIASFDKYIKILISVIVF
jgi:hypothetical protein